MVDHHRTAHAQKWGRGQPTGRASPQLDQIVRLRERGAEHSAAIKREKGRSSLDGYTEFSYTQSSAAYQRQWYGQRQPSVYQYGPQGQWYGQGQQSYYVHPSAPVQYAQQSSNYRQSNEREQLQAQDTSSDRKMKIKNKGSIVDTSRRKNQPSSMHDIEVLPSTYQRERKSKRTYIQVNNDSKIYLSASTQTESINFEHEQDSTKQRSHHESGDSGVLDGLKNWFGLKTSASHRQATKESAQQHVEKKSSKVKNAKPPQPLPCAECETKDREIERLITKNQSMSYQFMMEVELNLEGRNVDKLNLECDDFFDEQGQKLAETVNSDTLPCKIFMICYDFVHKKIIELCGTHLNCLFTTYNEASIPDDMTDIKNDKCRCYIKLVSTFEMNKTHPFNLDDEFLKDVLVPFIQKRVQDWPTDAEHPYLTHFLSESVQLSWKLATCVPPMIVSCADKRYDKKKHRKLGKQAIPIEHTLEYLSPVLYTNYTGHIASKALVDIKRDLDDSQQSEDHDDKPSLDSVKDELCDHFKEKSSLMKLAKALEMPQSKIDLVFQVANADVNSNLDNIIKWWINRQPLWEKLVTAVESTGNEILAEEIEKKHCEKTS